MTIGIIGAMDEEIVHFKKVMEDITMKKKAGITFYEGSLHGKKIVVCKCGVGKVNASICTQILIDTFHAKHIIFTGVAGAVDPLLNIGDIVISTDAMYHDMDATPLGFKKGEIPFTDVSIFPADEFLRSLAYRVSKEMTDGYQVKFGRILSGDQFIADRTKVNELYETFHGTCTEMEGAAVAHVCYLNEVPFVIIRSISDKADGSADVNFQQFVKLASLHSYKIVHYMFEHWDQ